MAKDIIGELGLNKESQGKPRDILSEVKFPEVPTPNSLVDVINSSSEYPDLVHQQPLTDEEQLAKTLRAHQDAISDFVKPIATLPFAGVGALGSLLAPVPENAPEDYRVNRASRIAEAVAGFGQSGNPDAQKFSAPAAELFDNTFGKFGRMVGDTTLKALTSDKMPTDPNLAAGIAATTHAIGELGLMAGFFKSVNGLKKVDSALPVKLAEVTGEASSALGRAFEAFKKSNPESSLGEFIRKHPEFKEEAIKERNISEAKVNRGADKEPVDILNDEQLASEPEVPASSEAEDNFYRTAKEFGGYENIPFDHPIHDQLTPGQILELIKNVDKADATVKAKTSAKKAESGVKLTFKERIAKEVLELGSLEAVEKNYAGKRHLGLARSIAKKLFLGDENQVDGITGTRQKNETTQKITETVEKADQGQEIIEPNENTLRAEEARAFEEEEFQRELQAKKEPPISDGIPKVSPEEASDIYAMVSDRLSKLDHNDPMNADEIAMLSVMKDQYGQIMSGTKISKDFAPPPNEDIEDLKKAVEELSDKVPEEKLPTFEDLSGAEEEYELNPRGFINLESAQKFAKAKGSSFEVIKVGNKYRVGQDLLFDEEEFDISKIEEAAKPPTDDELKPEPAPEREIIKVENFSKLGDAWVGKVDDIRSVAIIKDGPKNYEAFLGTVEEIQAGTAELIDSFSSLQKARRAFGAEGKSIQKIEKSNLSVDQVKEYLKQQIEIHQEMKRQDELARLTSEQEEDMLGDENVVSWEELAENEALDDYDEDGYYKERNIKDVAKDLYTILNDERGSLNPHPNPEISAAKKRIKKDISELLKIGKKVSESSKQTNIPFEFSDDRLLSKTKSILFNERGSVEGPSTFANAIYEIYNGIKKALKAIKKAAKAVKDWLLSDRRSNPYARYSVNEKLYMDKEMLASTHKLVDAFKTDASEAVGELVKYMEAQGRIVPMHDGVSHELPKPQRPMISTDVPKLKDNVQKFAPHMLGKLQSPSKILGRVFDTMNNPVIDAMEANMAFVNNWRSFEKWGHAVLKGIPDASSIIETELNELYSPLKPLVKARNDGMKKLNNLRELHSNTQDSEKKKELATKILVERKKLSKRNEKILEQLSSIYDNNIKPLAEKYADVRITLQAAQELPEGVKLSEKEMEIADKIRDYFISTRDRLRAQGIPVINERSYMHRILPELFTDPEAKEFLYGRKIPAILKFAHQSEEGRIWYPSAHMILRNYIPMVERKIAFQPFLNRWRLAMTDFPADIQDYMSKWIKANLIGRERQFFERMLDKVVAFEYMRLIGGSVSVAFKHLTKTADTFMRFDTVTNIKALDQTSKAVAQALGERLGVKGDHNQLKLLRAFVNSRAMVRMMDESPGLKILGQKFKYFMSLLVMSVETFDNGVSVMGTAIAAQSGGKITPQAATKVIWETILAANFRGGWDQPLFYKNVVGRILGMFQMTPYKLFEYRAEMLTKALNGEVDNFGTHYGTMLLRYIFLMGMA